MAESPYVQKVPIFYNRQPLPPSKLTLCMGRSGTSSNTWFLEPTQVRNPTGIMIGSAMLIVTEWQTDQPYYSTCSSRPYLASAVIRTKTQVQWLHADPVRSQVCMHVCIYVQWHSTALWQACLVGRQIPPTKAVNLSNLQTKQEVHSICITRMWANVQCDGRPAKYRWRPLFDAANFGWRPLLECRAVTLPRRETRWKLQGCPKLAKGSQPLVGRSSLYYQDMWRRYCCLTSLFPIVDTCLSSEDIARQICAMVPKWGFFGVLYFQRATCSTFQTCILNSH